MRFLTSDGAFRFDVPDVLDPTPDLYGVVTLDNGARELIYEPKARRRPPELEPTLRHRWDVRRSGVVVSVFEARDPQQLVAFWRLRDGYLTTFMNDEASCGMNLEEGISLVIASTMVAPGRSGLPRVRFRAPARGGDISQPTQREMIVLYPKATTDGLPHVRIIQEPTWAREGRSVKRDTALAEANVTNSAQITFSVAGPPDKEAVTRGIRRPDGVLDRAEERLAFRVDEQP
jgi:hypothetical protein